ncbi:MAG: alanyl-tRNA editing protein [Kosmotogaceae bacterium]
MYVKIANILEGKRFTKICFDNTTLFPDGEGGQLGDRGYIDGEYFESVERCHNQICVSLETEKQFNIGEEVKLDVDIKRRYDIAQQHTAQHLLSAIISKEFSAVTKGFKMGEEYSTIDINLPQFEKDHERLVEKRFFDEVRQCRNVYVEEYSFEEVNDLDLRKSVSDKLHGEKSIRIVSIDGIDKIACSGFHVNSTCELGMLKIIKTEKKKSNLARLFFVAGFRTLDYFQKGHSLIRWLNNELTCGLNEIPERIKKMEENTRTLKKQINDLQEELAIIYAKDAKADDNICKYVEAEKNIVEKIPEYIDSEEYILIGKIEESKYLIFSKRINLIDLYSYLSNEIPISGGCGKTKGQIVTHVYPKEIVNKVEKFLREE